MCSENCDTGYTLEGTDSTSTTTSPKLEYEKQQFIIDSSKFLRGGGMAEVEIHLIYEIYLVHPGWTRDGPVQDVPDISGTLQCTHAENASAPQQCQMGNCVDQLALVKRMDEGSRAEPITQNMNNKSKSCGCQRLITCKVLTNMEIVCPRPKDISGNSGVQQFVVLDAHQGKQTTRHRFE